MAVYPIWKDVVHVTEVVGEYYDYEVRNGADVIYRGRAYVMPNETRVEIPIARIVANYVTGDITIDATTSTKRQDEWLKTFTIVDAISEDVIGEYTFYADWSYGEGEQIKDGCHNYLSRPIQTIVDPRQMFVASVGKVNTLTSEWSVSCDGNTMAVVKMTPIHSTVFARVPNVADGTPITVYVPACTTPSYEVRRTNADYALYYMNAHGGWDYLLLCGTSVRDNAYTRVMQQAKASNLTYKHGERVITENIDVTWKLHTDYLNDVQWALLHHLIGSTRVYLHDLVSNSLLPVVVTDTKASYKTFSNQGKKKTFAEINVRAAQKRERR